MQCTQIELKRPGKKKDYLVSSLIAKQFLMKENVLTKPLYLKESCTDRNNNQNGHKNSNRNSNKKSAVITRAHRMRNFIYNKVLLE